MHYKLFYIPVIILFVLLAESCGTSLYQPEKGDASGSTSYSELVKGREIYINKCGRCHSLYLPDKHTTEEWDFWLGKMKDRAKISVEEKSLISNYVKLKAKK